MAIVPRKLIPPSGLGWVEAQPVTTFYLLAFAISWLGWIPSLLASSGISLFNNPLWTTFLVLPALGPTLAAKLVLNWQGHTPAPLKALFRWRLALGWYLVALSLPLLVVWTANQISGWLPAAINLAPLRGKPLAIFVLLSTLVNPWEEVGWRGFALRRLQVHYSSVRATLLVGSLWGAWHVPIFFIQEGPMSMSMVPFLPWFLGLLGWSFVLTWLYNHTVGSVLLCSLCHIAGNGFSALLGTESYWALAIIKLSLGLLVWLVYGLGSSTR